jgi:hypothetical protein
MTEIIFSHVIKVVLSKDFQFSSKQKVRYIKIEHTGCKPDHGRSTVRGGAGLGWSAHRGGQVAHPRARSGPSLSCVVLASLLSKIHEFHDQISFFVDVSFPHTCFLFTFVILKCNHSM